MDFHKIKSIKYWKILMIFINLAWKYNNSYYFHFWFVKDVLFSVFFQPFLYIYLELAQIQGNSFFMPSSLWYGFVAHNYMYIRYNHMHTNALKCVIKPIWYLRNNFYMLCSWLYCIYIMSQESIQKWRGHE